MMFFFGAEGAIHFVNGTVNMGQQVKFDYNVVGGFGISIFEFCSLLHSVFRYEKHWSPDGISFQIICTLIA